MSQEDVETDHEEFSSLDQHPSPLWMVINEPLLNDLVEELIRVREELDRNPNKRQLLMFSRQRLRLVRAAFDRMIRRGEEGLHKLCELFCHSFLSSHQIESVVIGEGPKSRERFTLTQIISAKELYSTIDLDLGNRQLDKVLYKEGDEWANPILVANVLEYQSTEPNRYGIHKIISRIKAEEELWNKVVDEIFGLDSLVRRDKQLRHMSRYVKDVFGIKIVVGSSIEAIKLQEVLTLYRWTEDDLKKFDLSVSPATEKLDILEVKNYLGQSDRKNSGWEAIKSVVRWNDRMFEIQIQPLRNFWREREFLTKESHSGFKSRREQVREQIAEQIPLFIFYQKLLRWLFTDPEGPAPTYQGVGVAVVE